MEESKEQTEKALKQTYADMYEYMIAKDTERLGALLDSSFTLIHMTGIRQPKADYLNCVKNGVLNYYAARHENIIISFSGNEAQIIGESRVNAAVFGGGKHIWRLRQTIRLIKKNEMWYMTESKASTY